VLILSIGRISWEKGVYDLLEIVSRVAQRNPRIACLIVGSLPAFDETAAVQKKLDETPNLGRVTLLPACKPEQVWEFLCAADIFAFTSHHEGMPNSLLEAMAMGVPAIAFGIPPVLELEAGMGALFSVPPFHPGPFAEAILRLAASRAERDRIGKMGRTRVMDRYMVRKNMAAALDHLSQSKRATLTH
jgi:glycosyltransferase involved in cell wall biosynthesis